jgi:hypothetical protein
MHHIKSAHDYIMGTRVFASLDSILSVATTTESTLPALCPSWPSKIAVPIGILNAWKASSVDGRARRRLPSTRQDSLTLRVISLRETRNDKV